MQQTKQLESLIKQIEDKKYSIKVLTTRDGDTLGSYENSAVKESLLQEKKELDKLVREYKMAMVKNRDGFSRMAISAIF